jgi:DnaJ-class molecular chaperone
MTTTDRCPDCDCPQFIEEPDCPTCLGAGEVRGKHYGTRRCTAPSRVCPTCRGRDEGKTHLECAECGKWITTEMTKREE